MQNWKRKSRTSGCDVGLMRVKEEDVVALATLLEHMLASLVDSPGEVSVRCKKDAHTVYLDFSTAVEDTKYVVGSKGVMLASVERVIHAASRSRGVKVKLRLAEDQLRQGGGISR